MKRIRRKIYEVADARRPEGFTGADVIVEKRALSGTLYPELWKMESDGLLSSDWGEPKEEGGPRPRVYWMTVAGLSEYRAVQEPTQ
jgi:DNA-binding PadR family transcriptional regulator